MGALPLFGVWQLTIADGESKVANVVARGIDV